MAADLDRASQGALDTLARCWLEQARPDQHRVPRRGRLRLRRQLAPFFAASPAQQRRRPVYRRRRRSTTPRRWSARWSGSSPTCCGRRRTTGGATSPPAAPRATCTRCTWPGPCTRTGSCTTREAAHYSVGKAVDLLRHAVRRRSAPTRTGEMDYDDLADQLDRHRDRPAIVVATIGTTMTEAVDDVRRISGVLDAPAHRRRFVHADAALAGIPLALLDPDDAARVRLRRRRRLDRRVRAQVRRQPDPVRRRGDPRPAARTGWPGRRLHRQPRHHHHRLPLRARPAAAVVRDPPHGVDGLRARAERVPELAGVHGAPG